HRYSTIRSEDIHALSTSARNVMNVASPCPRGVGHPSDSGTGAGSASWAAWFEYSARGAGTPVGPHPDRSSPMAMATDMAVAVRARVGFIPSGRGGGCPGAGKEGHPERVECSTGSRRPRSVSSDHHYLQGVQ